MKKETESQTRCHPLIWPAAILSAFLVLALAFFADAAVANWLHMHSSPDLTSVMRLISRVGDWPAHVVIGAIGLVAAYFAGSRDWQRIFLAMLLALALAGVTARVIKIVSGRARPSVTQVSGWNGPRLSPKYNAFPSGHTASSTAFFFTLFLARKRIGAPFLAIPLLIALSRMVVGAHYPSDVVFAALLGIVCAILMAHWLGIANSRNEQSTDAGTASPPPT